MTLVCHRQESACLILVAAHAHHKAGDEDSRNIYREKLLDMIQGLYDVDTREQGTVVESCTFNRQRFA